MADTHFYSAATDSAGLTNAMRLCAPHLRPILQVVRDCPVGMLFVRQGRHRFRIPSHPEAAIVMIGDDMDASFGPEGFHTASLAEVIRSCLAFAIVSSEPLVGVYGMVAAAAAVTAGNVMLVETRPEHEIQWMALIQKLAPGRPVLLSTVKGGHA